MSADHGSASIVQVLVDGAPATGWSINGGNVQLAAGVPAGTRVVLNTVAVPAKVTNPSGALIEMLNQRVAAPAAANSPGVVGQYAVASGFLYICVAANTWQRVAITTWP